MGPGEPDSVRKINQELGSGPIESYGITGVPMFVMNVLLGGDVCDG